MSDPLAGRKVVVACVLALMLSPFWVPLIVLPFHGPYAALIVGVVLGIVEVAIMVAIRWSFPAG